MKRFIIFAVCCAFMIACNNEKKDEAKTEATASETEKKATPQSEIGDPKYTEMGKKMAAQLSSGDIDGWMSNYADDARFFWSSGDSLVGKAAIDKYWRDRRTNVIDSLTYSNQVWIPLKVNTPQAGPDRPGVWELAWYLVSVKYKNGKKLSFWVHIDTHYNAEDKVDQVVQYIDMAPVKAALASK